MSTVLTAQQSFNAELASYAAQQKKSAQMHRRSDYGKAESRVVASIGMLAGLAGSVTYAYLSQNLQGADPSLVTATLAGPTALMGVLAYAAHQAAPYRQTLSEKLSMAANLKGIGSGFAKAYAGFTQSVAKLGDNLGLSQHARELKSEAKYLKGILGVEQMGQVKQIARNTYGKQAAHTVINDAQWLRAGIDAAVKAKLADNDRSPLSYDDIESGILKSMEKAQMLGRTAQESRGKLNVMERVVLMVGNANPSNLDLPKGDFSKIEGNHTLDMLKARNKTSDTESSLS